METFTMISRLVLLLVTLMAVKVDASHVACPRHMDCPAPIPPVTEPDIKDRVVLSIANGLSLALAMSPFLIRWVYGSWYITREIVPAKGVAANLVASASWTIYMMLNMYVRGDYEGNDALFLNSATMTLTVSVLLNYFLDGADHIRYWVFMVIYILMACCGMVWLVWHPNIIVSHTTRNILEMAARYSGIAGIALFVVVNVFPFAYLCAITSGERRDFTLLKPILLNTFLSCSANLLWAGYAWIFAPKHPDYFMIANSLAALMTFLQTIWVIALLIHHRNVRGQILDVESLRSLLLSVSKSLGRLAKAPDDAAFLTRNYLVTLEKRIEMGWQAMAMMELTFRHLEAELSEKRNALSAEIPDGDVEVAPAAQVNLANLVATSNALNAEAVANAASHVCIVLMETLRVNVVAFDAMNRAVKNKLSRAQGGQGHRQNLQATAEVASTAIHTLAIHLRPSMQVINASVGIPPTVVSAFSFCQSKMLLVKMSADPGFGCGAFRLRGL